MLTLSPLLMVAVIFVGGVVLDFLDGTYVRSVAAAKEWRSAGLTFLNNIIGLTILSTILNSVTDRGWSGILALSSGCAVGTFVGCRYAKRQARRKINT